MAKLKLSDTWKPYRGPNQNYKIVSCRFGVKLIHAVHKPHAKPRTRFSIYCARPGFPLKADQAIFRTFAKAWAAGQWWWYDGSDPHWVQIDKQGWIDFAAAIDYYITPTETRHITAWQAFLAWQQANLQPTLTRIQASTTWAPWYPPVQWPSPPPNYNPIIINSVTAWLVSTPPYIYYLSDPLPPPRNRVGIMYHTGPAHKGRAQSPWGHIMSFYYSRLSTDPVDDPWVDNRWWWFDWGCHGKGYIRPGLQIVDQDTGSPAPVVWADPIYIA